MTGAVLSTQSTGAGASGRHWGLHEYKFGPLGQKLQHNVAGSIPASIARQETHQGEDDHEGHAFLHRVDNAHGVACLTHRDTYVTYIDQARVASHMHA
eukprot:COSAG02_NODE_10007_length_2053_cov_1.218014_1_plen_98_part_00